MPKEDRLPTGPRLSPGLSPAPRLDVNPEVRPAPKPELSPFPKLELKPLCPLDMGTRADESGEVPVVTRSSI